mmetsp:Transcript_61920/g.189079  ORF Transcript_61920/g.189079 Transcript_61920/m.189079 type:complete len:232 (-) Transcript_61920:312-1007(-)
MRRQAPDLLAVLVVCDANDRVASLLDHLDERGVAAAVAGAHAVDLVHDQDGAFREPRDLLLAGAAEADRRVVGNAIGHLVNDLLPAGVGRVVLQDLVAAMELCHEPARRRLSNAWRAAHQHSTRIDIVGDAAAWLERHLLLLPPKHNVVPILQPIGDLTDDARIADKVCERARGVGVDPISVLALTARRLTRGRGSRGGRQRWRRGGRQRGGGGGSGSGPGQLCQKLLLRH